MSNTLLTGTAITRKAMEILHSKCPIIANIKKPYDAMFQSGGYDGQKAGPTIQIRKPVQVAGRETWAMDTQATVQEKVDLTIDQVRGADLDFEESELALEIDDFAERHIKPCISKVASMVETYCSTYIKNNTYQIGGTAGTQPNTAQIFLDAKVKLHDQLIPDDSLMGIISPATQASFVGALTPLQVNPAATIGEMFKSGKISNALGIDWYMSNVLARHTCGTRTNTTPVVSGATEGDDGDVAITGAGTSPTYLVGDIVTFAGCYAINPETKQTLPYLKQFVIDTATTCAAGGTGTLHITPTMVVSGPRQNVSAYPTNGGAVTNVGTASYTYSNDLLLHPDAFAFASAPLSMPKGMDMIGQSELDGIRLRFMRGFDIINSKYVSRVDIFFGIAALRPEWATRVIGYGA
jgi:hypothetical protein